MIDTTPTPADRPADQLRAGAEKLREEAARAHRASPAPWAVTDEHVVRCADGMTVADRSDTDHPAERGDLLYIALMHPGVGSAVARWLESWAGVDLSEHGPMPEDAQHALAVARQLLGTSEAEGEPECAMPGFVGCDCDHVTGCQHPAAPPAPADRAAFEALAAEWEKRGEYGDSSITDRARELRAVLADRAAICICGHPEPTHFEDVCQTCDCNDYLVPEAAREMIAHLHRAVLAKQDGRRATVLREAAEAVAADRDATSGVRSGARQGMTRAVTLLSRLADEAAAGVQPPTSEAQPARRRLTPQEYDRSWHAVEGSAGEEGADPGTVLHAVLRALRIDAPTAAEEQAASPSRRATPPAAPAAPEEQAAPAEAEEAKPRLLWSDLLGADPDITGGACTQCYMDRARDRDHDMSPEHAHCRAVLDGDDTTAPEEPQ